MTKPFTTSQHELEEPSPPRGLNPYNLKRFQRTVDITRSSIEYLESVGEKVTLKAISDISAMFDEGGKGISQTTIVRNPVALALFHQHSHEWQKRQARRSQRAHADLRGL